MKPNFNVGSGMVMSNWSHEIVIISNINITIVPPDRSLQTLNLQLISIRRRLIIMAAL